MQNHLPQTPAEALDLSTRLLRFKVNARVRSAELFGHWRLPRQDAATAFEEMTMKDICYWVYKSRNPILHMEEGRDPAVVLNRAKDIVGLPDPFDPQATVTLAAAGDILYNKRLDHSRGELFARVEDLLFGADIAYANFESPITTQPLVDEVIGDRAPPIECCSVEQFDVVRGHDGRNFDVLNTANNHIFDMGLEGLETTLRTFANHRIVDSGTASRTEDYGRAKILIRNGIKFGFTSVTFGLNGHTVPAGEEHRICVSRLLSKFAAPDLELVRRQLDHCKSERCDFIVASLHWGFEFEFFPRMKQITAARELVEAGADAIICHHPHVIQPVEYYRTRRDPKRVAVIAYSLGSLTWGFEAAHIALSLILNLTITKGQSQGREVAYLSGVDVTPVFSDTSFENGHPVTRIERLVAWQGASGDRNHGGIVKMREYCDLVL